MRRRQGLRAHRRGRRSRRRIDGRVGRAADRAGRRRIADRGLRRLERAIEGGVGEAQGIRRAGAHTQRQEARRRSAQHETELDRSGRATHGTGTRKRRNSIASIKTVFRLRKRFAARLRVCFSMLPAPPQSARASPGTSGGSRTAGPGA
ncbi:MAG: hypothetical protein B7Z40_18160 [Bosea sp. 12-68-7]|nr:MAG: hypothetical protein B7Z40_18160 [Bosea sp. 12-68-7]